MSQKQPLPRKLKHQHTLERHLGGSTIGIVAGVATHGVMHPGSAFTHFGHGVAHTVFTAFMAAHRGFAPVSRVPLFAHARARGGLALATATVGGWKLEVGNWKLEAGGEGNSKQATTWSV